MLIHPYKTMYDVLLMTKSFLSYLEDLPMSADRPGPLHAEEWPWTEAIQT